MCPKLSVSENTDNEEAAEMRVRGRNGTFIDCATIINENLFPCAHKCECWRAYRGSTADLLNFNNGEARISKLGPCALLTALRPALKREQDHHFFLSPLLRALVL